MDTNERPEGAQILVEDSGPGLPDSVRDTAVDQFGRMIGALKEGTGLGLSIASDVVRAHDGTLTASRSRWAGPALRSMPRAAGKIPAANAIHHGSSQ